MVTNLSCLFRAWLKQDAQSVNHVEVDTHWNRLRGHELGQMTGVRVIKLRKPIVKAEIESEAQQDNEEKMLCKL